MQNWLLMKKNYFYIIKCYWVTFICIIPIFFLGLIKEDRNKWSPLSTLNAGQLGGGANISAHSPPSPSTALSNQHHNLHKNSPTAPQLGHQSPYNHHQSAAIINGGNNGGIPSPHSAYHSAANANSFASPLSALLGTGSHYLFNSEAKGPTVQIF